jgi:hypothetical protein
MAAGTCGKVGWRRERPEGEVMGGLDVPIVLLLRLAGDG